MTDKLSNFESFEDFMKYGDVWVDPETESKREEFVTFLYEQGYKFHIHMESYEVFESPQGFLLSVGCV